MCMYTYIFIYAHAHTPLFKNRCTTGLRPRCNWIQSSLRRCTPHVMASWGSTRFGGFFAGVICSCSGSSVGGCGCWGLAVVAIVVVVVDDDDDDEPMGGAFIKEKGGTFSINIGHAGKFYRILSMCFMFLHPLLQASQLVSYFSWLECSRAFCEQAASHHRLVLTL